MKKKLLSCFLASTLVMTFIPGCGKSTETADPSASDTVEVSGTDVDKNVSLTIWCCDTDDELMQELLTSFKSQYSDTNFNFTVEHHNESSCKDDLLLDPLNSADVFTFADDQLSSLAAAGVLEPLGDDASDVSSRNIENSVSAASIDGSLYAYPLTADNGYFLYYNKKYLNENDVTSLDKILEVAAANNKKFLMDITSGWYFYSFFGMTGLEVGVNENGITNYCTWNSTENTIKGVDVLDSILALTTNPAFLCGGDDTFLSSAKDDSVIAAISGIWNSTDIEKIWGNDYGTAKLPAYSCAGQQVQMSSFAGYKLVGVNSYSPYSSWGTKLANYLTSEESQQLRFKLRGQGPSNINVNNSSDVANSPAIQALLSQSPYSSLQRIGPNYWNACHDLATLLLTGDLNGDSPQSVMDRTTKQITALISF